MKIINTSAIVVGAGPAGASTSIFLAKAGIHHFVLEKDIFPRDKICGDACSGKTAFVLRSANPAWIEEIHQQQNVFLPSYGIKFVAPNGKGIDIPYKPDWKPGDRSLSFTATRFQLDNFIFQKIDKNYATVLQGIKIKSIEKESGKIIVAAENVDEQFIIKAPVIVGADGDKGIVRKTFLNEHAAPKAPAVGLRVYYDGITGMHEANFLELHFLPEIVPGYLWIFPLPNGAANVGIGMLSEHVRKKKINLRELMLHAIKVNPNIKERFANAKLTDKIYGWGLPTCMKRQPVSGEQFLLTGDAASLIDPFSGEGIGNALFSGKLAAAAIEQSFKENDFTKDFFSGNYDDVLFGKIGDELKISVAMQKLCRYPWLFNFIVNKAHKSPSLQKTISCMFSDLDLRAQLKKPSFYFKILMNR